MACISPSEERGPSVFFEEIDAADVAAQRVDGTLHSRKRFRRHSFRVLWSSVDFLEADQHVQYRLQPRVLPVSRRFGERAAQENLSPRTVRRYIPRLAPVARIQDVPDAWGPLPRALQEVLTLRARHGLTSGAPYLFNPRRVAFPRPTV